MKQREDNTVQFLVLDAKSKRSFLEAGYRTAMPGGILKRSSDNEKKDAFKSLSCLDNHVCDEWINILQNSLSTFLLNKNLNRNIPRLIDSLCKKIRDWKLFIDEAEDYYRNNLYSEAIGSYRKGLSLELYDIFLSELKELDETIRLKWLDK